MGNYSYYMECFYNTDQNTKYKSEAVPFRVIDYCPNGSNFWASDALPLSPDIFVSLFP